MNGRRSLLVSFLSCATGAAGPRPAAADPAQRAEKLCGISLWCSTDKSTGFLVLPSAKLGIVQLPFGGDGKDAPSRFNAGFGVFKPSIGATFRYFMNSGWWDVHGQFVYGESVTTSDGKQTNLWGVTAGIGAPFSILSLDFGVFNRRYREDANGIDTGFAVVLDLDLTAAGVAAATSK